MIINDKRALAYVVTIDEIKPIDGYDRVEYARTNGWWVIISKNDNLHVGDKCVYFEVDSKVNAEDERFAFLEKRNYKIKTQKMCKVISQGLLMPLSLFPELGSADINTDVTDKLKVTYAVEEDNARKGKVDPNAKYRSMAARHQNIFKKPWVRWMMRREWGRRVMFFFFGKKKDSRTWPQWVVKTDEERVQNMTWILEDKSPWFATEKIDGTSTTFTMKGYGRKREFYICSRNVVFDTPEKEDKCFYDTNVYTEMAQKYDVEHVLDCLMEYFSNVENKPVEFVTLQGETYGAGVQKRDYHLDGHDFKAFNLIVGFTGEQPRRLNPEEMTLILDDYGIPCVPIVSDNFVMPDTVDELLEIATDASAVDGDPREGLVFRSADGVRSFKAVSNEFLLKYHG